MPLPNDAKGDAVRPYGKAALAEATALLKAGGIVAVPTETVYGLAADSASAEAVAAIYRAKGRPDFNPLIVHVPGRAAAGRLARFDDLAGRLAAAFWPGPLTLVLPLAGGAQIAPAVTAGLPTIAVRCPAHPAMQALLRTSGLALAAPSANRSGGVSPTSASHVAASLGAAVPLILDAGSCTAGIESTIVAVREGGWQLLRPGPVTREMLEAVVGPPFGGAGQGIEAPGQLPSHYAPRQPVRLNVLRPTADAWHIGFGPVAGDATLSARGDLAEAAAQLFARLHEAEASGRTEISVAPVPSEGIGAAINDRLSRAAAGR